MYERNVNAFCIKSYLNKVKNSKRQEVLECLNDVLKRYWGHPKKFHNFFNISLDHCCICSVRTVDVSVLDPGMPITVSCFSEVSHFLILFATSAPMAEQSLASAAAA